MPTRVITWHDRECLQFPSVQQFSRWATDAGVALCDVWFVDVHMTHTVRPCHAELVDDGLWQLTDMHGTVVASSRTEPVATPRQRALMNRMERAFDDCAVVAVAFDEWTSAGGLYEPYGFRPVREDVLELCPELIDRQADYCQLDENQWELYVGAFELRLHLRRGVELETGPEPETDIEAAVDDRMVTVAPNGFGIMNDVALSLLQGSAPAGG